MRTQHVLTGGASRGGTKCEALCRHGHATQILFCSLPAAGSGHRTQGSGSIVRSGMRGVQAGGRGGRGGFGRSRCRHPPWRGCSQIAPNLGRRRLRPELDRKWPRFGRVRPSLAEGGLIDRRFVRHRPKLGQIRPSSPKFGRVRVDLGRKRSQVGRNRPPRCVRNRRNKLNLDRAWPADVRKWPQSCIILGIPRDSLGPFWRTIPSARSRDGVPLCATKVTHA